MKIGVIGGGNMGFAYMQSVLNANLTSLITVVEPNLERGKFLSSFKGIEVYDSVGEVLSSLDLLILAVKPQMFSEAAAQMAPFLNKNQVAVSIMAGISIAQIVEQTGLEKVVRAMPNTPCQLGVGVTGYYCYGVNEIERKFVESVFSTNGLSVEMERETLLNEVTAVSGSGPAYFFTILKHMISSAENMGLSAEQAKQLVFGTMKGAYELASQSESSLDELITAVTSKGGTTEAALRTFEENNLAQVIDKGLLAARNRSVELSKL